MVQMSPSIADNFDDNSFNGAVWSTWGGAGFPATESSQRCNLNFPGSSVNAGGVDGFFGENLAGLWVGTKLNDASGLSANRRLVPIIAVLVTSPIDSFRWALVGSTLTAENRESGGAFSTVGSSISYNPAVHVYLAVGINAAGRKSWLWSTDGVNFTEHGTATNNSGTTTVHHTGMFSQETSSTAGAASYSVDDYSRWTVVGQTAGGNQTVTASRTGTLNYSTTASGDQTVTASRTGTMVAEYLLVGALAVTATISGVMGNPQDFDGDLTCTAAIAGDITPTRSVTGNFGVTANIAGEVEVTRPPWPTPVKVELYYDADWHDITGDIYTRDSILVTFGRQNNTQRVAPSHLTLSIKNTDFKYSWRFVGSALYGKIGRNTPIRVSANGEYFFWGEVESWPLRWTVDVNDDGTKGDVWAPIDAFGILNRLQAAGSRAPARSAPYRYIAALAPVAWWPVEGGADSATGSPSPLTPDVVALVATYVEIESQVDWGKGELAAWLPNGVGVSGTVQLVGTPPPLSSPAAVAVDVLVKAFTAPSDLTFIALSLLSATVGDDDIFVRWDRNDVTAPDAFLVTTAGGLTTLDTATDAEAELAWDDQLHHWRLLLVQDGADIDVTFYVDGVAILSGTQASATLGSSPQVEMATNAVDRSAWGHPVAWVDSIPDVADAHAATFGHAGETVEDRFGRLCAEEGIAPSLVGVAGAQMGPQLPNTFLELLFECADVDGGILHESRSAFGLRLRARADMLNQTPVLNLDYKAGGEVAPPLNPVEDTSSVRNDITVKRRDGGFSRAVKTTGPLNVSEPTDDPQGVGRIPAEIELNLYEHGQTQDIADWHLVLGTVDEPRYEAINLNLTAMIEDGKPALMAASAGLTLGDHLAISRPPLLLGAGSINQLVQGMSIELGDHLWTIGANTEPASPWAPLGHLAVVASITGELTVT